jgi:hypothetical protein
MKTRYQEVLELRGKPIANLTKRKPSKKVLERFKGLEESEMFQLHLIASGIRKIKEGVAK